MLTEIRNNKYKSLGKDEKCPFNHEVNSLRVVDKLAQFDRGHSSGLNLTWEVRDGIVSHNGEDFSQPIIKPFEGKKELNKIIVRTDAGNPRTLEGCIVKICDKVAYVGRDLEDAIHAGLIDSKEIDPEVMSAFGLRPDNFINGEITKILVTDIINESDTGSSQIAISKERFEALKKLYDFNLKNIYKREELNMYKSEMKKILTSLFDLFFEILAKHKHIDADKLRIAVKFPPQFSVLNVFKEFVETIDYAEDEEEIEIVIDFLSGFTDNYVLKARAELLEPKPVA